jgi:hypothetical protein
MKCPSVSGNFHGDRPRIKLEDCEGIERIAVHAHDILLVERCDIAQMKKAPKRILRDIGGKVKIGLGSNKIFYGHAVGGFAP